MTPPLILPLATLILSTALPAGLWAVDSITVDTTTEHQTIMAWGVAGPGIASIQKRDSLRIHMIDEFVNGLGLTRVRGEIDGPWERFNDNTNPYSTDTTQLNNASLDAKASTLWLPMKQLVEANGETFTIYSSLSYFDTGSTGTAPAWLLNSPGEHTENILTRLLRMRDVHGITPDYCVVINEAGYHNAYSSDVCVRIMKEAGPRIAAAGLPTKFQYPECTGMDDTLARLQAIENEPDVWQYIGLISSHLYYKTDDSLRISVRDFALSKNLPTAQTEYLTPTIETLYTDITNLGTSVWEWYGNGYYWANCLTIDLSRTWFSRGPQFWNTRQILRYVRPGAVRVVASTTGSGTALRPLAFKHNSKVTVVILNTSAGNTAKTADVSGLTPSTSYGISRTVNGVYAEMGLFTSSAAGTLAGVAVPAKSVVTLYPAPVTNQPPMITDWRATPPYLTQPANSTTLSAAAQDPELAGALSYAWSVTSQPAGAAASLASPSAASCTANNLSVAGDYVFSLTVTDAAGKTSTKTIEVPVFATNQPPSMQSSQNRNPVVVLASATASTEIRASAWDLEGDLLQAWDSDPNVLFKWEIISQPSGAAATLTQISPDSQASTNPATPGVSQTSYTLGALTVAGNYVLQVSVKDALGRTDQIEMTVPVYPANASPTIPSGTAAPSTMTLPNSSSSLTATTNDPDAANMIPWRVGGDVLTHWWTTKTAPAGAVPVFATPGSKDTTVSGLLVPGQYTFTLTAIDRAKAVTKDVTLTVNAGTPSPGASTATNITSAGATLNGSVNSNGTATLAAFQYATDPSFTDATTSTTQNMGSGGIFVNLTPEQLSGLTPSTTYYFRTVANSTLYGATASFTTTSDDPLQVSSAPAASFNPGTGFYEQTFTVTNSGPLAAGGFQLRLVGVPAGVSVVGGIYDSGSNSWTLSDSSILGTGTGTDRLVQYSSVGDPGSFTPTATVIPPPTGTPPADPDFAQALLTPVFSPAGTAMVQFSAVPGRQYQLEYSPTLQGWLPATGAISARNHQIQWTDDGTATLSLPANSTLRFYRAVDVTP